MTSDETENTRKTTVSLIETVKAGDTVYIESWKKDLVVKGSIVDPENQSVILYFGDSDFLGFAPHSRVWLVSK